jgi:antitoxin ParD1/3/4
MLKIDKDCYSREHQRLEVFRMNVSLTPELEEFVGTKVGSGRYNSASEVVREALRLLEEHDQARSAQIAAFNKELGHRLASLDRGEKADPAAVRARIASRSRARRKISA